MVDFPAKSNNALFSDFSARETIMGKKAKKAGMHGIIHYEQFYAYHKNIETIINNSTDGPAMISEQVAALEEFAVWTEGWDHPSYMDESSATTALARSEVALRSVMSRSLLDREVAKKMAILRSPELEERMRANGGNLEAAIIEMKIDGISDEIESRSMIGFYSTLDEGDKSNARVAMPTWFHLGQFLKYNKRVFKISTGLGRVFADMSIKYPVDIVRTPYRSQYVQLPPKANTALEGLEMDGAYVYRDADNKYIEVLLVEKYQSHQYASTFPEYLEQSYKAGKFGGVVQLLIDLTEKETLEDALQRFTRNSSIKATAVPVFRMILHAMLYATSSSALMRDVESKRKSNVSSREYRRHMDTIMSDTSFVELGGDIDILPPQLNTGSKKSGRTVNARFMVRGHYSHYWYLKENVGGNEPVISTSEDDCKVMIRKFLEPYWKGPDTAEKVLRDYVV